MLCICCGQLADVLHHVVYRQELRRVAKSNGLDYEALIRDGRNLVPMRKSFCHANHHARAAPLRLALLPPCVYAFAAETLGTGPAYEFLRRRYAGEDARLDALLHEYEREAA